MQNLKKELDKQNVPYAYVEETQTLVFYTEDTDIYFCHKSSEGTYMVELDSGGGVWAHATNDLQAMAKHLAKMG